MILSFNCIIRLYSNVYDYAICTLNYMKINILLVFLSTLSRQENICPQFYTFVKNKHK